RPRRGGLRISTAAGDVDADVLVVGVGTVPNTELAEQAGLPAGHGIEVDECFATAAPGIYAIGDVAAQHLPGHGRRVRVEHHDTAIRHGRVAARNMAGQREPFADVHWFWSDQYDHTISSAGLIPGSDGPRELVIRGSLEQRGFSAFSLDGDRVRAVISLNRPRDVLDARRLIARDHSATAGQLRDGSLPRPSPRPERGPRMSTTLAAEWHVDEPQLRVTESDARSALRAVTGKAVIPARARLRFGPGRTCEAIARLLDRAIVRAESAGLDPRLLVVANGSAEAGEDIVRVRRKAHGVA